MASSQPDDTFKRDKFAEDIPRQVARHHIFNIK